ncbi:MAG: DUF5658 family protein [Planctomycetota bacterium]
MAPPAPAFDPSPAAALPVGAGSADARGQDAADRRGPRDRRARPTRALSRYTFVGRRRGARRASEAGRQYVDRFRASELVLAAWIAGASAVDLALTLVHLRAGGSEANPLMAWLIGAGGLGLFCAVKLAMTTLGSLVLLVHARFPLARFGLVLGATVYAALMVWHAVVADGRGAL